MKHLLIATLIIIFSCTGKKSSTQTGYTGKTDTTRTFVVYYNTQGQRIFDLVYKIYVDTFSITDKDGKRLVEQKRDFFYYPPMLFKAVDSTGKQLKSLVTGQDSLFSQNVFTPKENILVDFRQSPQLMDKFDSIMRAGPRPITMAKQKP